MFNIYIDYPARDEEIGIVQATTGDTEGQVSTVMGGKELLALQRTVRRVPVSNHVVRYATDLARATRPKREGVPDFINDYVSWGAGPRAAQYLVLGAKARALLAGKFAVSCQDVRNVALPVLRHRILCNFNADAEGITPDALIRRLVKTIPEPSEKDYR